MLTFNDITRILEIKNLEYELENFLIACEAIERLEDLSDINDELTYQNIGEFIRGIGSFAIIYHIESIQIDGENLLVSVSSYDGSTSDCGLLKFPISAFNNLDDWFKKNMLSKIEE